MITKEQALSAKDKVKDFIIEQGILASVGVTVNLDGDYVIAVSVADSPLNVEILAALLTENFPELLFAVKFTGRSTTL